MSCRLLQHSENSAAIRGLHSLDSLLAVRQQYSNVLVWSVYVHGSPLCTTIINLATKNTQTCREIQKRVPSLCYAATSCVCIRLISCNDWCCVGIYYADRRWAAKAVPGVESCSPHFVSSGTCTWTVSMVMLVRYLTTSCQFAACWKSSTEVSSSKDCTEGSPRSVASSSKMVSCLGQYG